MGEICQLFVTMATMESSDPLFVVLSLQAYFYVAACLISQTSPTEIGQILSKVWSWYEVFVSVSSHLAHNWAVFDADQRLILYHHFLADMFWPSDKARHNVSGFLGLEYIHS
jgi:hypothetical protein